MANQKILLPYNFTAHDHKAADFVIANFAQQPEVEITLFHAYIPPPKIEASKKTITEKLTGNLAYFNQRISEQENELKAVVQSLHEAGFAEQSVQYIFQPRSKDIAGDIIELAHKWRFGMVVLNHKPGKISRFFTGSVYNKVVMALSNTIVCIVS